MNEKSKELWKALTLVVEKSYSQGANSAEIMQGMIAFTATNFCLISQHTKRKDPDSNTITITKEDRIAFLKDVVNQILALAVDAVDDVVYKGRVQ